MQEVIEAEAPISGGETEQAGSGLVRQPTWQDARPRHHRLGSRRAYRSGKTRSRSISTALQAALDRACKVRPAVLLGGAAVVWLSVAAAVLSEFEVIQW
jgi:hypothetical protein